MFTDIVGYTTLMGKDSDKALKLVTTNVGIQKPIVEKHNGTWIKEIGDGTLASFSAAIDAVNCAIEIQRSVRKELDSRIRIGIHIGDIIVKDNDVYGDGVNVASRLEAITEPGGIYISDSVHKAIRGETLIETEFVGDLELRNVDYRVRTHAIQGEGLPAPGGTARSADQPEKRKEWGVVQYALIVLLASVTGLILYLSMKPVESDITPLEMTIAVLPFKTIGGDPEGRYFSEGVQEEILNHLSRIKELRVKSRTSVESFRDRTPTREELVSDLKLTHYLEGSARKEGNRVRITVQLINAENDEHLWAENYERDYENIWETQSDIAKNVAQALSISISPETASLIEKQPTANPLVWEDYLKAMYHWRQFKSARKPDDLNRMVRFLKSSISGDPDFALGYSYLAWAYQTKPENPDVVFKFIDPDSVLILCNKAIELDPGLSTPYVFRAQYYAYVKQDTVRAIQDFETALATEPGNYLPYYAYGYFQIYERWDMSKALELLFEALETEPDRWALAEIITDIAWSYLIVADYPKSEYYFERARAYDPESLRIMSTLAQLFRVTGRYDRALQVADETINITPEYYGIWQYGMAYMMLGNYEKAVDYFGDYIEIAMKSPAWGALTNNHMYGYSLMKIGRTEEGKERIRYALDIIRRRGHSTPNYEYAKIYSALGITDSAYYYLEKAVDGHILWGMSDFIEKDPLFESIREEPEFQRLVRISKDKVAAKRAEVKALEESGAIPTRLDRIEIY